MTNDTTTDSLEYTGERMVPEKADWHTFWEHVYRYRFATTFVPGKRVLDIACGEGYGARALLDAGAAVIGVDLSEEACGHARRKYGIDARQGDAERIPLPDRSVDVVVSFETIEHVPHPAAFLAECERVLTPGGVLVASTPNRRVYSATVQNHFHCSEMDEEEFRAALQARFAAVTLYTQRPATAAWWSPRSWVADRSVWNQMRGSWRLRALVCPHIFQKMGTLYRTEPTVAILRKEGSLASCFNPFVVRRQTQWAQEQPYYLIAVAQKEDRP